MEVPYPLVFLALLAVYMGYSAWVRLDARYPVGAALVLLVVAAVADAAGSVDTANTVAEYVFFLLAGGVVLLLIDHLREERTGSGTPPSTAVSVPPSPAGQPTDERDGPTEHSLDGAEQ